jgi:hypothetical protein
MRDGKVVQAGKYDDLLSAGTDFNTLVDAHNEAIDLVSSSSHSKEVPEEDISKKAEELVDGTDDPAQIIKQLSKRKSEMEVLARQLSKKKSEQEVVPLKEKRQLVQEEERGRGQTSLADYWTYLSAVYYGAFAPVILLTQLAFQTFQIFGNYWMTWASPINPDDDPKVNNQTLIGVYCLLALATAFFISARSILTSIMGLLTSQKLFLGMLRAIFRAPMSFFDSTPTGRILARVRSSFLQASLSCVFHKITFPFQCIS